MGSDKGFKSEAIGHEDAFAEGEREALARIPVTDVRRQMYLPCVGGPLNDRLVRVPSFMLQSRKGSGESPTIDLPASSSGLEDHLPRESRTFATYRLDRSSRVWRFVSSQKLGG